MNDQAVSKTQKEHEFLQQFVGEWTYETVAVMGPDTPSEKFTGTESGRVLGGMWAVLEGEGFMPDAELGKTLITLGYDADKRRYVGSCVGSMMPTLWIYDGEMDSTGKKLVMTSSGPSFTVPKKTAVFRDVFEFKGPDERTMTASVQDEDGNWNQFMVVTYKRKS